MLNLIEFVKKINIKSLNCNDYRFYIVIDGEELEIEPVYNIYGEAYELVLKEEDKNIIDEYSLTKVLNANYKIEEVESD